MTTFVDEDLMREVAEFTGWGEPVVFQIAQTPISQMDQCEKIVPKKLLDRVKYVPKAGHLRLGEHWGQLKLLLSEIEFLSDRFLPPDGGSETPSAVVVYAGAAPGVHIPFLSKLFSHKIDTWVLVDPAPFAKELTSVPNIVAHRAFFTDDMALELRNRFRGRRVMFISDIRRDEKNEKMISEDMADQKRWTHILKPYRAMLKFRLPYVANEWLKSSPSVSYLKGKLVTQAFAAVSGTEARLITNTTLTDKEYDSAVHEKQMFALNLIQRSICAYPHPLRPWSSKVVPTPPQKIPQPEFWDWNYSYDTMRMLGILLEYVRDGGSGEFSREIAELRKEVVIINAEYYLYNFSSEEWAVAAALSLLCMRACGHTTIKTKRSAPPDGILTDKPRALRFRRKWIHLLHKYDLFQD